LYRNKIEKAIYKSVKILQNNTYATKMSLYTSTNAISYTIDKYSSGLLVEFSADFNDTGKK
jgi:hypothetical protein